MNYFRMKLDGRVVSEAEYRNMFPNTLLPSALIPDDADVILQSPQPAITSNQYVVSSEPVQDALGNWVQGWEVRSYDIEEIASQLISKKEAALQTINNDDNRIYADVIGNKATEYTAAETAAGEYKAANYVGTVPEVVQSWADAKKWTAKEAADDILLQAYKWRQAAALIRRKRLKAKEDVRTSTTAEEVAAALSQWQGFVNAIRSQLGV